MERRSVESIERELRHLELRMGALFRNLPNVVLYETGAGREFVSDNIEKLLGYTPEEITQDRALFPSLIHPEDSEAANRALQEWSEHERHTVLSLQFRARNRSGDYLWLEDHIINAQHEDGSSSMIGVLIDVTHQRNAEEARRQREEQFRLMSENSSDLIARILPGGVWSYVSPSALDLLGYDPSELLGRSSLDFVHPDDLPRLSGERQSIGVDRFLYTWRARRKDEEYVWLETIARAVRDEHDTIVEWQTSSRDVTARKVAEEQLQLAKQKAEELSRVKSSILANFSHELRTPLHSILGFASLLLEEMESDEQRVFVTSIQKSGERLLNTLSSVLELANLESDSTDLMFYPVELGSLLREIEADYRQLALDQRLDFVVNPEGVMVTSLLDRIRLRQALQNILSNAFKFTRKGSVRVWLSIEPPTDGRRRHSTAVIRIVDTGIGMSQAFLPRAFEEFQQESTGWERSFEGAGLGLTIARSYIRLMNGTISLNSSPNKGTEVTITFPAAG